MGSKKRTAQVFGISNTILDDSYVNRGGLDEEIQRLLERSKHIALRGESKCGKSWLRQKNIKDALVVHCRLKHSINDIYTDALYQLGIELITERASNDAISSKIKVFGELGTKLLAKIGVEAEIGGSTSTQEKTIPLGNSIDNLRFISDILIASKRKLVIEDFHYLSAENRKQFSYDLKTLWDYGCFVVIIGAWAQDNLLTYINQDLVGRINEIEIYWTSDDLARVISEGSSTLNIEFADSISQQAIQDCFGNVGILQNLLLLTLDKAGIFETSAGRKRIDDGQYYKAAAEEYATQLIPIYQTLAARISEGMYKRENSTGIYAHVMKVILESSDEVLIKGIKADELYRVSSKRQSRIQLSNLKKVLRKLQELQVNEEGRGLIIAYDEMKEVASLVDRQLLLYRKYVNVKWPWDEIIKTVNDNEITEIAAPKRINQNSSDVFHHPSNTRSSLQIEEISKNKVFLALDFTTAKPDYAGYVVRFNNEDWSGYFYNDYAISFDISGSPNINRIKLEVKKPHDPYPLTIFTIHGILVAETTMRYRYKLCDYVSDSSDLESIAELVFLFTPESSIGMGKAKISNVEICSFSD